MIPLGLSAVAVSATHRGMKLVQRKRCLPIVGEYQVVPGPARLRVAGATCRAHLAGVRVDMARLTIMTQADKPGVHESASVFGDTMALVAPHVRVLASERKRRIGPVGRHQPAAIPAVFTVTLLTGFGKLAAVRIVVTKAAVGRQPDEFNFGKLRPLERDLVALVAFQAGVMPVNRTSPVFWHFVTGQALHLVLSAVHGVQV